MIKAGRKKFKKYISSERIQSRVQEIAKEIRKDYKGKRPVFVSVLNGAILFTADLIRHVDKDAELEFVKLASYRGTRSTGKIRMELDLNCSLKGRHVIVLEDIVDSGRTIQFLLQKLRSRRPASVRVASLLFKPASLITGNAPDYIGFFVPADFLIGYGLDYNGAGRNLCDIYVLVNSNQ